MPRYLDLRSAQTQLFLHETVTSDRGAELSHTDFAMKHEREIYNRCASEHKFVFPKFYFASLFKVCEINCSSCFKNYKLVIITWQRTSAFLGLQFPYKLYLVKSNSNYQMCLPFFILLCFSICKKDLGISSIQIFTTAPTHEIRVHSLNCSSFSSTSKSPLNKMSCSVNNWSNKAWFPKNFRFL